MDKLPMDLQNLIWEYYDPIKHPQMERYDKLVRNYFQVTLINPYICELTIPDMIGLRHMNHTHAVMDSIMDDEQYGEGPEWELVYDK